MTRRWKLIVPLALAAAVIAQPNSPMDEQMLATQNAVRKSVGVPPLVWSAKLASAAARWADTLAKSGKFEHQTRNPYGENLFEIMGATATPGQVVSSWAGEGKNFLRLLVRHRHGPL